ncbi:response regulator [Catenulispora rubra]|uniref:response regulator n=1 Tax=Catenulispora rubra TaxID=280293 RepID=UPI0018928615|nr:response regulator transcription factor [Catenulispora rubra]
MSIRVLIADDQELLRAAFRMVLEAAGDMLVVGEAADGAEAARLAHSARADVVLMDIRMPGVDGIAATRLICGDEDLAGVKVLILTTFENDEYVAEALRAGASGFLGKGMGPEQLLDAIRMVAAGESLLSPAATRSLITAFITQPGGVPASATDPGALDTLTERERDIVTLVGTGLSNQAIAERFAVSPFTVKTHVNRAMAKLGVRDRAQLVIVAYESGLVHVRPKAQ